MLSCSAQLSASLIFAKGQGAVQQTPFIPSCRAPIFELELPTALFKFRYVGPAFEPLFQFVLVKQQCGVMYVFSAHTFLAKNTSKALPPLFGVLCLLNHVCTSFSAVQCRACLTSGCGIAAGRRYSSWNGPPHHTNTETRDPHTSHNPKSRR